VARLHAEKRVPGFGASRHQPLEMSDVWVADVRKPAIFVSRMEATTMPILRSLFVLPILLSFMSLLSGAVSHAPSRWSAPNPIFLSLALPCVQHIDEGGNGDLFPTPLDTSASGTVLMKVNNGTVQFGLWYGSVPVPGVVHAHQL